MVKDAPAFVTPCSDSTCVNQTPKGCIYPGCVNRTIFWYRNFTYDQQGTWFYRFNLHTAQTSGSDVINIGKDDINASHAQGNGTTVNRTGTNSVRLIAFANDTDAAKPAGNLSDGMPAVTVYFNVTTSQGVYTTYGSGSTNETGHAYVDFNPGCTYSNGTQSWIVYTSGDSNYKDNSSQAYQVTNLGRPQAAEHNHVQHHVRRGDDLLSGIAS